MEGTFLIFSKSKSSTCIIAVILWLKAEYRELYRDQANTSIWWQKSLKSRIKTAVRNSLKGIVHSNYPIICDFCCRWHHFFNITKETNVSEHGEKLSSSWTMFLDIRCIYISVKKYLQLKVLVIHSVGLCIIIWNCEH